MVGVGNRAGPAMLEKAYSISHRIHLFHGAPPATITFRAGWGKSWKEVGGRTHPALPRWWLRLQERNQRLGGGCGLCHKCADEAIKSVQLLAMPYVVQDPLCCIGVRLWRLSPVCVVQLRVLQFMDDIQFATAGPKLGLTGRQQALHQGVLALRGRAVYESAQYSGQKVLALRVGEGSGLKELPEQPMLRGLGSGSQFNSLQSAARCMATYNETAGVHPVDGLGGQQQLLKLLEFGAGGPVKWQLGRQTPRVLCCGWVL